MLDLSQFRTISFKKRNECAVCQRPLDTPTIQLPDFPVSEIYVDRLIDEKIGFVDQNFHVCTHCGHGQISNIIDPNILYSESYFFRTSTSKTARRSNDFFLTFIQDIIKRKKFKKIFEIGCNDLYLLNSLKSRADHLIGIDPVLKSDETNISDKKITVIGDFFENIDLSEFGDYNPSLILSSHTLEHMENPRQFIQLLFEHFNEKSVFIFQFPGFETLVDNYRFDQVFHQHLQYFSLKSIIFLLNKLEGELIDFRVNPHHWGSLMVAFKKKSKKQSGNQNEKFLPLCRSFDPEYIRTHYEMFKCQMNFVRQHLTSIYGEKIYGYGAALMLPILAYHLNNDLSCLECVIDDDVSKHGMYYINLPVKICPMPDLEEIQKSVMLITAIDNTSIILPKALSLNPSKIILPFNSIC